MDERNEPELEPEGRSSDPGTEADRFRHIAEMLCDYAYVARVAENGRLHVEWLTPGFTRLFGYTAAEIMALQLEPAGIDRIIHPADQPLLQRWFERLLSGEQATIEHRAIARSGESFWLRSHGRPIRGAAGRVTHVYGAAVDISAEVRAQHAASDERAQLKSIVAHSPFAIVAVDYAANVTSWNPAAERLFGWKAADVLGKQTPLLGPDQDAQARQLVEDVFCGQYIPDEEGPRHRLDGSTIMVSVSRALLRDAEGAPIGVVAMLGDITEQRRAAAAVRESERNFRDLIEWFPDALAIYREDEVVYVNQKARSLLGYEPEEAFGKSPFHFIHPGDRAAVAERIQTFAMKRLPSPPAEQRFIRRDGTSVPVEVTSMPVLFEGCPATLVHARDLTERKRLEAQLLLSDRLASLGRLSAAVGHEINNPLAYVLANLDLCLERLGDQARGTPQARLADIAPMLAEARQGADRVRHIVRDLKVFARGESEERVAVDPRRVLDSCVNMARPEIRSRATIVKRYGDTPMVMGSEARVGQVLLNLLINAGHAIPVEDPDTQRVEVATSTDERGWAVIEVSDTGTGIPDEVRRRMFEPFFTTKEGGQGTGLGLPICQSIVTALGGEITVESQVGRGTTFRVLLPPAPPSEARRS